MVVWSRVPQLALTALVACGSAGCGIVLQSILGWSSEELTRNHAETQTVEVSSTPPGAEVSRKGSDGGEASLGKAPLKDTLKYTADVTVVEPSVTGLAIGSGVELLGGLGLIELGIATKTTVGTSGSDGPAVWAGRAGLIAMVVDLIALGIAVGTRDTTTTKVVQGPRSVEYVARLSGLPDKSARLELPEGKAVSLVLDPNYKPPEVAQKSADAALPSPSTALSRQWVVAIMEVQDPGAGAKGALDERLLRSLSDQLRIFIARQGTKTIDSGAQDKLLRDQITAMKKESFKSCYDESCQIELGKALAASHIVRSHIARFGKSCVINAEVVDLRAEVSVRAASARGACEAEGFLAMSEEVARQLFPGR
jgi:hypothetical protein